MAKGQAQESLIRQASRGGEPLVTQFPPTNSTTPPKEIQELKKRRTIQLPRCTQGFHRPQKGEGSEVQLG
jgi:hypothetical protein